MECNRDEALRAKIIAESKLTSKDYSGAKKFALKATSLYPELEGISQMLTILDVYTNAEYKIHGEVDWYRVLGVTPFADGGIIKKAYRKLALSLHPDKNKAVGADGAFRYVSEAWSLLSDKAQRSAYNKRRNLKGSQVRTPSQSGVPSAPFRSNDFQRYSGRPTTNVKGNQTNTSQSGGKVPPKKNDTFWTICNGCKTHYEYLRIYLNQNLLCPNCNVAFSALETPPPPKVGAPVNLFSNQHQKNFVQHTANNGTVNAEKDAMYGKRAASAYFYSFQMKKPRNGSFPGAPNSVDAHALQNPTINQQTKHGVERLHVETESATNWDTRDVLHKVWPNICTSNPDASVGHDSPAMRKSHFAHLPNGCDIPMRRTYFSHFPNGCDIPKSGHGCRELPLIEMRALLMMKAKTGIQKKLKEWSSVTDAKPSDKGISKLKDAPKEMQETVDKSGSGFVNKNAPGITSKARQANISSRKGDDVDADGVESMTVPDSDFHDFDLDRTERSFSENEVWTSYDNDDGMPRYYALVHKVISTKPFKLKISWLNSKSNKEFGPSNWVDSGFSKTCGIFWIGRHETNASLNSFSHRVEWTKVRGAVHIYPKKGDVWALYKNWSPDWDENTPDEVIHKYDMVEVLDDYNEEQSVSVIPLVKVPGFRTVFQPQTNGHGIMKIGKEEMFRFSHQVPYYIITGEEAENAPKGCRELDPAATPIELLQVISDSLETGAAGLVENSTNVDKSEVDNSCQT